LNKKTHILISEVYCVWQVVKTTTVILNNPVYITQTAKASIKGNVWAK